MPIPMDLEPRSLQSSSFGFERNLSEIVIEALNDRLRDSIAQNTVRSTMESGQLVRGLHELIDETAPSVFISRYRFEQRQRYGTHRLHELLGRMAISEADVSEMIPGELFMADVHKQIDTYQGDIEALKHLHDLWPSRTFEHLSALNAALSGEDARTGDEAFEIVRKMSEDTENLTLDPDHPEALLLLTHIPGHVRQLARRLLVGNHIVARMERALGESATPEEEVLLGTLRRYYALDNLHGQQWEAKDLNLSEDSQVEIARYSAEQLRVVAKLQQETDKDSGQRFKEVWVRETNDLNDITESANRNSNMRQWQLVDVGHAFQGFLTFDLQKAFRYGLYEWERVDLRPQKSGLKAAILEDDDAQRALWRETVQNSTSFTTQDNLTFASPEGLDDVIDDPTIGLFVLDIQNADDSIAGIRIGEEVIRRRRYLEIGTDASSGKPRKTKVIIWSASSEAVQQASTHFRGLIEDSMPDISYSIGGNMRDGASAVTVDVRRKTWHTYKDLK